MSALRVVGRFLVQPYLFGNALTHAPDLECLRCAVDRLRVCLQRGHRFPIGEAPPLVSAKKGTQKGSQVSRIMTPETGLMVWVPDRIALLLHHLQYVGDALVVVGPHCDTRSKGKRKVERNAIRSERGMGTHLATGLETAGTRRTASFFVVACAVRH